MSRPPEKSGSAILSFVALIPILVVAGYLVQTATTRPDIYPDEKHRGLFSDVKIVAAK